jgi:nicotinate phosphoribosyltransferase
MGEITVPLDGEVGIFCSGNLDEHEITRLLAQGAPIDGLGVGTRLDCAYKLVEYAGQPRRKRSEGKATWPGRKQVYRIHAADGSLDHDILTLENDMQAGTPLIQPFMLSGKRLAAPEPLEQSRHRAAA